MKLLKFILSILVFGLHLWGCSSEKKSPFENDKNIIELLTDGDLSTSYTSDEGVIKLDFPLTKAVTEVLINTSGLATSSDPVLVKVSKSSNGENWEEVVEFKAKDLNFLARFHQVRLMLPISVQAAHLRVELESAAGQYLSISEVAIETTPINSEWDNFPIPTVNFKDINSETQGSLYYNTLVQKPAEYIAYHAKIVAQQLYFSADDLKATTNLNTINYNLKDYDGVSGKSGSPPIINIDYSTRHVESSYATSLYALDHETRGVLYHELTHGYQSCDLKGIPGYSHGNLAWAAIEGLADAVRINLGYTSMHKRIVGGGYMDGYNTTGFFIQWLTTKDADAIRNFNASFKELSKWSFDGAMQYIFNSTTTTVNDLWSEYQTFLKTIK